MMTDDDIKIRFTTTAEERKIIRDRLNLLTTPFGKKEGCEAMTKPKLSPQRGSVGSYSIHPYRASLNSRRIN